MQICYYYWNAQIFFYLPYSGSLVEQPLCSGGQYPNSCACFLHNISTYVLSCGTAVPNELTAVSPHFRESGRVPALGASWKNLCALPLVAVSHKAIRISDGVEPSRLKKSAISLCALPTELLLPSDSRRSQGGFEPPKTQSFLT